MDATSTFIAMAYRQGQEPEPEPPVNVRPDKMLQLTSDDVVLLRAVDPKKKQDAKKVQGVGVDSAIGAKKIGCVLLERSTAVCKRTAPGSLTGRVFCPAQLSLLLHRNISDSALLIVHVALHPYWPVRGCHLCVERITECASQQLSGVNSTQRHSNRALAQHS